MIKCNCRKELEKQAKKEIAELELKYPDIKIVLRKEPTLFNFTNKENVEKAYLLLTK